jgi:glycerol-3-phosphate acyltransferase PlsY
MLGHVFPVFFQFKGGKGVATSVGIFAVCNPLAITLGLIVFAIILIISKLVSLSSLIATVTVVTLSIIFYDIYASQLPQAILILMMGVIIFIKHKDNIKRLITGTENKIGGKKNG